MAGRILVTRPQPGADRTARRLSELGFVPVVLPLFETVPVAVETSSIPAVDALVVTSANAFRHAPETLIRRLAATPCFAVGGETGELARSLGLASVEVGPGDASALAERVASRLGRGAATLYLCGKVRLDDFERILAERGLSVHAVETYDTVEIPHAAEAVSTVLQNEPLSGVLLYSAKAASLLCRLVEPHAPMPASTRWYCLSRRVAAALSGIDPGLVRIAAEPSEAALLELLEKVATART